MKLKLGNYDTEMVFHDPTIFTVEEVMSNPECEHFKKVASLNMRRSLVSGFDKNRNKRGLLDNRRTSSNCWISHSLDEITLKVAKRISELVTIGCVENLEKPGPLGKRLHEKLFPALFVFCDQKSSFFS